MLSRSTAVALLVGGTIILARRSLKLRHDLATVVPSTDEWTPLTVP